MAIEIVDFPIKNGGSFHCFLYVHQRVTTFSLADFGLRIDVQLDHLIDNPGGISAPQATGVHGLHAGGRERGRGVREDHELLEMAGRLNHFFHVSWIFF